MHALAVTAVDSGKRALELLGTVRFTILLLCSLFSAAFSTVGDVVCVSFNLFQEPNVSMIITDYWMPEMTGYELLKKIKVRAPFFSLSLFLSP